MRVWYFSEMAYHPSWDEGLKRGSLRVNFPNKVVDPNEAHKLLNRFLDEWLCSLPSRDHAVELLQRHRVPVGPVYSIDEVGAGRALRAAGAVGTVGDAVFGPFEAPGVPLRFSAIEACDDGEAPFLGEHNEEVALGWGGLDTAQYGELCAAGVLRAERVAPRPSQRAGAQLAGGSTGPSRSQALP